MANRISGALPVKVDATSNGEFRPVPLTEHVASANREAGQRIIEYAKRVGLGRRVFLQSLCGAATTLLTLNEAFGALGNTGGFYRLPEESTFEPAAAADALAAMNSSSTCKRIWLIRPVLGAATPAAIGSKSLPTFPKAPAAKTTPSTGFRPSNSSNTYSWTAILNS